MKPLLILAAAIAFPLAAHAQDQNTRFRYLGIADDFAVMASAPDGPQEARKISLMVVNRTASGPGGADGLWADVIVDCAARENQMLWSITYLGDAELTRARGPGRKGPARPNTPYSLLQDFACTDWQPAGEPVFVDGADAARRYARTRIEEIK